MRNHRYIYGGLVSFVVGVLLLSVACAPKAAPAPAPEAPAPEAALAKPAWQVEWEKTLIAARKEGSVVVYGELGTEARAGLTKPLKNKYGISLEVVAGRGAETAAKVLTEQRAGLYLADLIRIGQTSSTIIKDGGGLDPIEPFLVLPEVIDPKAWYGDKLPYYDKERKIIVSFMGPGPVVSINTNLVKKDEIKSAQDLLNLKWKGKIVASDPTQQGAGLNTFGVALEVMGLDYLKKLAEQEPFLTRDRRLAAEWVAKGKYSMWIGPSSEPVTLMLEAGAPIGYGSIPELTYLSIGGGTISVANRAPHPNAAKVFLNWVLTKEGQTLWGDSVGHHSARLDVLQNIHEQKRRIPSFKYAAILNEEFASKQPEHMKIMEQIFGHLVGR